VIPHLSAPGRRTYERSVHVEAPLSDVWAFHSTVDGLIALTPDWLHLHVDSVVGPDGEDDPGELVTGTTLHLSVQPFGVGPRQSVTSVIVDRYRREGEAQFVDEMVDGPFSYWEHTHLFRRDDAGTLLTDRVTYKLPMGSIGDALGAFATVGFAPMFRFRHRETRRRLEHRGSIDS
jgi:ligand-binding SRPBCC domain-containing protein